MGHVIRAAEEGALCVGTVENAQHSSNHALQQ